MKKKVGIILLGLFISAILGSNSFGQDEAEVMKRYDFSSPKTSFESYKKAIQEKDFEGFMIHGWEIGNRDNPVMKFKDALAMYESNPEYKERSFEEINRLYTAKGNLKITEVDFVRESERKHITDNPEKVPVTICKIIIERKSDGMQATIMAYNFDGTREWWIFNYPGGE